MTIPLVSVVMPAYNHEDFVGEAIDSVLRQTWEDLELIIVNDGSTDRTADVAIGRSDRRIRYVEQANHGAHAAINRGIELARGRLIALINSDDTYHPSRLDSLVQWTRSRTTFLAFTNLIFIDAHTRPLDESVRAWLAPAEATFRTTQCLKDAVMSGNLAVTTSNFFFSADVVAKLGLFCPRRYTHDYDFLFRALCAPGVECIYYPDAALLNYRVHGRNTYSSDLTACLVETVSLLAEHAPRLAECEEDSRRMRAVLEYTQLLNVEIERLSNKHRTAAPFGLMADVLRGLLLRIRGKLPRITHWPM